MRVDSPLSGKVTPGTAQESTATDQEARRQGIGGSEAAAALGQDKYKTPLRLWMEKTGRADPEPAGEAAEWGTRNEPALLQRMAEHLGQPVVGRDINGAPTRFLPDRTCEAYYYAEGTALLNRLQHRGHPFMLGHIDGFVESERNSRPVGWVEAKTASEYLDGAWGAEGTDQIPHNYYLQISHYDEILRSMGAGGLPWHVGVLIGGNRFRYYQVRPTAEDRQGVVDEEAIFWTMVELDIQPPVSDAQDAKVMNELHPKSEEVELTADEILQALGDELAEARANGTYQDDLQDKLVAKIKERMGTASKLVGDGWWVTWRTGKDSTVTDWKAVVNDLLFHLRLKRQAGKRATVTLDHVEQVVEEHTETKTGTRSFRFNQRRKQ